MTDLLAGCTDTIRNPTEDGHPPRRRTPGETPIDYDAKN
jgi:hypothetical protein